MNNNVVTYCTIIHNYVCSILSSLPQIAIVSRLAISNASSSNSGILSLGKVQVFYDISPNTWHVNFLSRVYYYYIYFWSFNSNMGYCWKWGKSVRIKIFIGLGTIFLKSFSIFQISFFLTFGGEAVAFGSKTIYQRFQTTSCCFGL